MNSFTVLEYLFRSGFRILFSGFLLILELEYMFLELLLLCFVVDVWYLLAGSMYSMFIFRFGNVLWRLFEEPMRFMCLLKIT